MLIAGNWKMNLDRAGAIALAAGVAEAVAGDQRVDVLICPPAVYLDAVMDAIDLPHVMIDSRDKIGDIGAAYAHSRKISRPVVAVLTKKLLQGRA